MIDLDKLSKPWKKAILYLPPGVEPESVSMPEGVEVVQVSVTLKLYGEGLPEKFRTKGGERLPLITMDELAELPSGSST